MLTFFGGLLVGCILGVVAGPEWKAVFWRIYRTGKLWLKDKPPEDK